MTKQTGRLTLPTDADIVEETIRLKNLLGADALRDCDGTEMPDALLNEPVKNMQRIIRPERIMPGPSKIRKRFNRNT